MDQMARQLEAGVMILELSHASSNVMLDALGKTMDGGSIELLADAQRVLAVLYLLDPAATEASGGELKLNHIAEDRAPATGAMSARIIGGNGTELFSANSDATIKLTPQLITRGAPVRIDSFRLVMP